MQQLYTPWRMDYIKRGPRRDGCLFCKMAQQAEDAEDSLLVARSAHNFIALNRYPYSYGHLLVVPYAHLSSPEDMSAAALADAAQLTNRALQVLRDIANPDGFNIGANIGAAAGASVAAHYHFHIVPRWKGDANFMTSIGATRTIPDSLPKIQRQLREKWRELGDSL